MGKASLNALKLDQFGQGAEHALAEEWLPGWV